MIDGLGIDMIEVDRIAGKISKEAGFRELVFSPGEIAYCESKANKFEHYAARFAAKEAFFKALGTGWADGTAFSEVEITHNASGRPDLNLLGRTRDTLTPLKIIKILVSLSHIKTMASAVVIIEK
ncbi:MAG TPA: holo-ACP synthase [Puia sp.]|nr:holo-ACP synthase [Puia sp.]